MTMVFTPSPSRGGLGWGRFVARLHRIASAPTPTLPQRGRE